MFYNPYNSLICDIIDNMNKYCEYASSLFVSVRQFFTVEPQVDYSRKNL